jgi:DNA-binding MarR family transcriptional regulator
LNKLYELRRWGALHLPIDNSLIAYDLFLFVAMRDSTGEDCTVKELFGSLPYSYTAIRSHYLRFLQEGLIELHADGVDKRVRYVVASKSFREILNSYLQKAQSL